MTVVRRLNTTFTDPTDLPFAIPTAGVAGVAYRWRAAEVPGNDGDLVETWDASTGSTALTQAISGQRPTLKIEDGQRMLRFDGTDDEMSPASALLAANLKSVTIVARVRPVTSTGEGILNTGTGAVQRGTSSDEITDQTVVLGGGTGASNTAIAVNPTSTSVFHVITVALGLDQGGNPIRQATVDDASAAVNGDASPNTIRPGLGYVGTYGNIDILEIIAWPFALTTTQRAAVRSQIQAAYPGLIV